MAIKTRPLTLTVNGVRHGPLDVPEGMMLLDVLHEYLGLTGSRFACGQGMCYACTVILDRDDGTSQEIPSCITGAAFFDGKRIRTIEGIAARGEDGMPVLTPLQQKYLEHFSFQCGYCTPGFVVGGTVLLERLQREPVPADQVETVITAAMNRHVCRCTGYVRYLTALREVVTTTEGLTTPRSDMRRQEG